MSDSLWPCRLYSPWNSPGGSTGVGSLSLLQGIFPTQGSNPRLPQCRQILYHLSHQGSLRILEWVAYPFSRGSSLPRNQTRVFWILDGFFTNWTIREAHWVLYQCKKKKKKCYCVLVRSKLQMFYNFIAFWNIITFLSYIFDFISLQIQIIFPLNNFNWGLKLLS